MLAYFLAVAVCGVCVAALLWMTLGDAVREAFHQPDDGELF